MADDMVPAGTQDDLFEHAPLPGQERLPADPEVIAPEFPVWTDNKARFIAAYLRFFVYITKHGTYIDGFAGPQEECETDSWAAKLVLESEPRWMRHFHLCDANREQVKRLRSLKAAQPDRGRDSRKISRDINIYHGDFNRKIADVLSKSGIRDKEATFCLLDQRTFECDWATVEKLARHKKAGHKIELFYFLANGWLERALSGQKDMDKLARWWGRDDWTELRAMSRDERRDAIVTRMKRELGYKSVMAWPIFERQDGGKIMYYMIHATDHPEAPGQMSRAYRSVVRRSEPFEQLKIWQDPKAPGEANPTQTSAGAA
jgi:three-Cys-motif partner protein